jgi:hypothetical protein
MADYTEIKGNRIQYLDSDPTLTSATEGQVWYNTATGTLKGLTQIKAWSSGGNLPTATSNNGSATQGTQTASLSFGGGSTLPQTIEYNGYSWTTSNNLGTPRYVIKGAGVQTAALGFGGYTLGPNGYSTATEEYDGTSWTAGGSLPSARGNMGSNGTQTAALAVGGYPLSPGNNTEEYNGTSWTAGGGYPVALQDVAIAGPQTAALGAGGISGPPTGGKTLVCNYDGSSWTALSATIPNGQNRGATAGGQTHAVVFGGNTTAAGPPNGVVTTATNEWDGSTFSITANMATARQSYGGAGSASTAIGFGGDLNPGSSNATEEYNSSINATLPGTWSSANNMNVNRFNWRTDVGTQTATLVAGGGDPGNNYLSSSEEYDGAIWTSGGSLPQVLGDLGGGGTQTAAFASGGNTPTDTRQSQTSNYDGTSWTVSGSMPFVSGQGTGWGTQTAGAHVGGYTGTAWNSATAEYNGSTWTTGGSYPIAIAYNFAVGTQTAGLSGFGLENGSTGNTNVNEYDGSSWTAGGSNNTQRPATGAFGIQTSAIYAGGSPGAGSQGSAVEEYNGTGWTSITSTSTLAAYRMGAGTDGGSGIIMGGNNAPTGTGPNNTTNVAEEWTNPSGAVVTASTLTTS